MFACLLVSLSDVKSVPLFVCQLNATPAPLVSRQHTARFSCSIPLKVHRPFGLTIHSLHSLDLFRDLFSLFILINEYYSHSTCIFSFTRLSLRAIVASDSR